MFISKKHLRIMFNNVDEFIRVYDGTKYSLLFDPEKMLPLTIGLDIS